MSDPDLIERMLVITTGHLTTDTRRWLEEQFPDDSRVPINILHGRYGWLVWAGSPECGPEEDFEIPMDLAAVRRFCRENSIRYVMFDCDAPIHDDLPVYSGE